MIIREQINLPIDIPEENENVFLRSESNNFALTFINSWPNMLENINIVILYGPHLSGKSILLNIWANNNNGVVLKPRDSLKDLESSDCFIIDDLEMWLGSDIKLLHLINYATHSNKHLLITSSTKEFFKLFSVNDLISRINSAAFLEIYEPDENLSRQLLILELSKKQIKVDVGVIEYIISNYKLTYNNIFKVIELIDKYSMLYKKKINNKTISKICEELQ